MASAQLGAEEASKCREPPPGQKHSCVAGTTVLHEGQVGQLSSLAPARAPPHRDLLTGPQLRSCPLGPLTALSLLPLLQSI